MHVYAPGAQGYKSIVPQLNPANEWKLGTVYYPQSRTLYLSAIKEKMPVFSGRFQIKQDATVWVAPEFIRSLRKTGDGGKTIELRGTLFYQACNNTTCFLPERVPVAWQFTAMPLDTNRASEGIRHPGDP